VNTENVVKHLRVLWRTDRIIADIRMRHLLVGFGLRAFAALIATFGLLMLELSAYFALVQIWSAISAAAILGAVNFVIAALLFVIAARPAASSSSRPKSTAPRSMHCRSRPARCSRICPE
jgi:membrane protein implicated in regulation of membrane protease activity